MGDDDFVGVKIVTFDRNSHVESASARADDAIEFVEVRKINVPDPRDIVAVVDVVV